MQATELTGLIITKLDGTSKGGVVIGIVNEFEIPVRYIGLGEQLEDLRPFDAQQFTKSIFAVVILLCSFSSALKNFVKLDYMIKINRAKAKKIRFPLQAAKKGVIIPAPPTAKVI